MRVHDDAAPESSGPTTEIDAREFGLHVQQGGWRLGLLVARNVERGKPGRPPRIVSTETNSKVSATVFAKLAKTTNDRVLRYLDAWERAADAGHVPHAADLSPGSELELDAERLPQWSSFYNARRYRALSVRQPTDQQAPAVFSIRERSTATAGTTPPKESVISGPSAEPRVWRSTVTDAIGDLQQAVTSVERLASEGGYQDWVKFQVQTLIRRLQDAATQL